MLHPKMWICLHGEYCLPHHGGISSLECDAFLHALLLFAAENSSSTLLRRYLSATKQTNSPSAIRHAMGTSVGEQPCDLSIYLDNPRVGRLSLDINGHLAKLVRPATSRFNGTHGRSSV